MLNNFYKPSLSLLTDLYQVTMAYAYWKSGKADTEAVFHLFYRKEPFGGGYAVACGLGSIIEFLEDYRFDDSDLQYLSTLKGHDGKPLFEEAFFNYLRNLEFTWDIDAVEEGTPVFINEPLMRVKGPLLQAQLIETALLTIINYQTLVATKSSRICQVAEKTPVLEFGLRRAQGIDGGLTASRAAFIGGCASTSNVLAGKLYGIPVSGTHAHSWIMSFDNEMEAFRKYAEVMDNNCILLVDTYNSRNGIVNAIEVGKALKAKGKKLIGIRIDSGDLAYLSKLARDMLDEAGLQDTKIVVTNDLDEHILDSLHDQGAKIDIAGVGTKLVTAYDQPALGGVYKLSAIKNDKGAWINKVKLSEQTIKINIPGIQQVRRFYRDGEMLADMTFDIELGIPEDPIIIDPNDPTRRTSIDPAKYQHEDLLKPIFRKGKLIYQSRGLQEIRQYTIDHLEMLSSATKRFVNPQIYTNGVEHRLYESRLRLILEQRKLIS